MDDCKRYTRMFTALVPCVTDVRAAMLHVLIGSYGVHQIHRGELVPASIALYRCAGHAFERLAAAFTGWRRLMQSKMKPSMRDRLFRAEANVNAVCTTPVVVLTLWPKFPPRLFFNRTEHWYAACRSLHSTARSHIERVTKR